MTIYNAFWVLITNDRIFHNLLMLIMMMDGRDDFPKWNSRLSDELPLSVPLPDLSKLPSSPSSSSRRDRDSRVTRTWRTTATPEEL